MSLIACHVTHLCYVLTCHSFIWYLCIYKFSIAITIHNIYSQTFLILISHQDFSHLWLVPCSLKPSHGSGLATWPLVYTVNFLHLMCYKWTIAIVSYPWLGSTLPLSYFWSVQPFGTIIWHFSFGYSVDPQLRKGSC